MRCKHKSACTLAYPYIGLRLLEVHLGSFIHDGINVRICTCGNGSLWKTMRIMMASSRHRAELQDWAATFHLPICALASEDQHLQEVPQHQQDDQQEDQHQQDA